MKDMILKMTPTFCVKDVKQEIENGKFANAVEAYEFYEKQLNDRIAEMPNNVMPYKQKDDEYRILKEKDEWMKAINDGCEVLSITRYFISLDNIMDNINN